MRASTHPVAETFSGIQTVRARRRTRGARSRLARAVSASRVRFEPLERRRLLSGGDFSLDFVAAAPFTYDHATGGGAFDDRTIGKTADVVESLEGGDFKCGDIVTYLVAIDVDGGAVGAQTIDLNFEFLSDATGQSGVGHDDIVGVKVNDGAIAKVDVDGNGTLDTIGDGPSNTDSGNTGDHGSVATLISETLPSNPFHSGTTNLKGTVRITDCEAGEQIILRVDVHIDCDDNASPTGNLQAAITSAKVSAPVQDTISVGQQTVPFKNIGELIQPAIDLDKTGTALSKIGDPVTYTYTLKNTGNVALDDIVIKDDAGTPGVTADDFQLTVPISGDTNGNLILESTETWTFTKTLTVPAGASDPFVNTATVTANAVGTTNATSDTDTHSVNLFQPKIDVAKSADRTDAAVGDTIKYTYTVKNLGSADSPALVNVKLTDDNGTPGNTADDVVLTTPASGDTDGDGKLDLSETWTYTANRVVTSSDSDPLVNKVVGTSNPDGFPNNITDDATASVNLFQPAISIDKTGDSISKIGDDVTYKYELKNSGSADSPALENVKIVDDAGTPGNTADDFTLTTPDSGDTDGDGKLDIGETWKYSKTFTIPAGATDPFVNTATASAKAVGSTATVSASDTHSVDLFAPAIDVKKTVSPLSADIGGTVTYTVTIKNITDTDLATAGIQQTAGGAPDLVPVSLTDTLKRLNLPDEINNLAVASFVESGTDDNKMQLGETWTLSYTYTLQTKDFPSLENKVEAHFNPEGFPNDVAGTAGASLLVTIPHVDGRMTGGGSIFTTSAANIGAGVRVTHGFQLHCNVDANNRLEVNWGKPNQHFHLSNLTEVHCMDHPFIIQAPPDAPIDTLIGKGLGVFSGTFKGKKYSKAPSEITFIFIDAGEPGGSQGTAPHDSASYIIKVLNGPGAADDVVVLNTGDNNGVRNDADLLLANTGQIDLTFGNHQAHDELKKLLTGTAAQIQRQIESTLNALDSTTLSEDRILSLTSDLNSLFAQLEAAIQASA